MALQEDSFDNFHFSGSSLSPSRPILSRPRLLVITFPPVCRMNSGQLGRRQIMQILNKASNVGSMCLSLHSLRIFLTVRSWWQFHFAVEQRENLQLIDTNVQPLHEWLTCAKSWQVFREQLDDKKIDKLHINMLEHCPDSFSLQEVLFHFDIF